MPADTAPAPAPTAAPSHPLCTLASSPPPRLLPGRALPPPPPPRPCAPPPSPCPRSPPPPHRLRNRTPPHRRVSPRRRSPSVAVRGEDDLDLLGAPSMQGRTALLADERADLRLPVQPAAMTTDKAPAKLDPEMPPGRAGASFPTAGYPPRPRGGRLGVLS